MVILTYFTRDKSVYPYAILIDKSYDIITESFIGQRRMDTDINSEVIHWLQENIQEYHILCHGNYHDGYTDYGIEFKEESELVLFQLRWST